MHSEHMLQSSSASTSTYPGVYTAKELFHRMYLRAQYARCVYMLICQYTHPFLANMLAVISSCRFIC